MYTLSNPRPHRVTIAAVKLIEREKIAPISQSFRKHLKFLSLDDEECNFSRKKYQTVESRIHEQECTAPWYDLPIVG